MNSISSRSISLTTRIFILFKKWRAKSLTASLQKRKTTHKLSREERRITSKYCTLFKMKCLKFQSCHQVLIHL